ncbi:MAG: HRDC domain-containing protein [Deltaproteobacteria bacterium]|nr:HRDC domain-containing protein [Deltaproteobacteria bacterium]
MPFKIITIPFEAEKESFLEEELNRFCLNRKIKNFKAEFFTSGSKAYWTIFLEYEEVLEPEKTDYGLTEPEKLLYQRLREWRKDKAEKAGVPVYIVATNGELRELIKKAPKTIEALKAIRGFGRKKIEKHGKEITELIREFYKPTP